MAVETLPIGGGVSGSEVLAPTDFQVASRDAVEFVPIDEDTSLFTTAGQKEKGGDYLFTSPDGEPVEVLVKRADLRGTDFTLGSDVEVNVSKSRLTNVSFTSSNLDAVSPDSLTFGSGANVKRVSAEMGAGDDSIAFRAGTKVSKGAIDLGEDADSVVFGRGVKVRRTTVDLGADTSADVVEIEKGSKLKGVVIANFSKDDTLVVGGQTYTYDQLEQDPKKVQGVRFRFDEA